MRKNHDLLAMEEAAKSMISHTLELELQVLTSWMSTSTKDMSRLPVVSDILEKKLGFKYFTQLKSKLCQEDYAYFLTHLTLQHWDRGSIIIDKGKKNDSFYIILHGDIAVLDQISFDTSYKHFSQQNRCITETPFEKINSLKPGDIFGEVTLINPKMLTTARVVAKSTAMLLVANQDTFYRTLNQPEYVKFSQKVQYFKENILFEGIQENKIRELLPEVREIRYALNEHIYLRGHSQQEMYFIVQGEVELINSDHKKIVTLGMKQYFGVERANLDSTPRNESAKSKSQNLILYRIFFKRLVVLGDQLPRFMKSLIDNLQKKVVLHRQLDRNHRYIQSILKNPDCGKKRSSRKTKTYRLNSNPSLEWWGVTNSQTKSANACRIRNRMMKTEPSQQSLSGFSNNGVNKIDSMLKTTKSCAAHIRKSLQIFRQPPESQYIPLGCLEACFSKKVHKVDQSQIQYNKYKLRKRVIPKKTKQTLITYARSDENFCENLYLD